ncbi:DUF6479 family protein [Streptomyces sp. NPDC002577]
MPFRTPMSGKVTPVATRVVTAAAVAGAVGMGLRYRRRAAGPRGTAENEGPLDLWEVREPDEVPTDRGRLMPYELGRTPNKRSTAQYRRRWSLGSSGGFGSGGIGRTG